MLRIQVELPGDLPTKVLNIFIVILATENPLPGSSVINAISKTHSNETKKGLISLAYPLSWAMGIDEDSSYSLKCILNSKKENLRNQEKKINLIPSGKRDDIKYKAYWLAEEAWSDKHRHHPFLT